TYIELYDADENLIDEDDDGGENYDSYLSVNLEPGDYYIKVTTLDSNPPEDYYLLSVEFLR
ncbi:MAG: DVUA0089 family protein, partial [Spirochaetaceae bacterium]|nr:DVUA0089 family protein [Spirochaetaceae bacterium]